MVAICFGSFEVLFSLSNTVVQMPLKYPVIFVLERRG